MQNVQTISSNAALLTLCHALQTQPLIALDTEFIRVGTFFSKPGLIQLYEGKNFALIDPLAIDQWQPFVDILENEAIVKVFHACDEDIELLYHAVGAETRNVFDTQIAAALTGMDFSMGYQRLVSALFDVDLPKGSSRSDWLKRPLSEEQIHYALDDVRYLPEMYHLFIDKLQAENLEEAIGQEYAKILDNLFDTSYSNAYQRVNLAWQLKGEQFGRLKALATFREKLMRRFDLPRKHIATNEALMELAQKADWQAQALYRVTGLPAKANKAIFDEWLDILHADYAGHTALDKPKKADKRFKAAKHALVQLACEHGIAESLLIKKTYFALLCKALEHNDPSILVPITPWRRPFYDKVFQTYKRQQA